MKTGTWSHVAAVKLFGVILLMCLKCSWYGPLRWHGPLWCATGREWAATTTEGLLVYSLDHNLVFDPFDFAMDVTPQNVRSSLERKEYSVAMMMAFRLNEHKLIQEIVEMIPVSDSKFSIMF